MTFEPSPAAREMAEALRAGVSARLRDYEAATPDEDLAQLRALGAVDAMAPVAKPTAWAPVVRGVRHLVRAAMRPWLAAQTAFNTAIAARCVETATASHAMARRVTELERHLEVLRDQISRAADRGTPAAVDSAPRLDRDTLLRLIVQSRIRRPPARVLVAGSAAIARDLAAFGFEVVSDSGDARSASAAPFDVVVWLLGLAHPSSRELPSPGAALTERVRTGGQAIVAHEATDANAAAVTEGLMVRQTLRARDEARGWIVVEEPVSAGDARRSGSPGEITVVVAERPHATHR